MYINMADDVSTLNVNPTSKQSGDNGIARMARLRAQMERTTSESIREEGKELRQAAEQSLNIILDLTLDGHIRRVSPTWTEVVGTDVNEVQGKPIADLVVDNERNVFLEAANLLQNHDHASKVVRFSVPMGSKSKYRTDVENEASEQSDKDPQSSISGRDTGKVEVIDLEAQGILVYDRSTGEQSHVSLESLAERNTLTVCLRQCG